MERRWRCDRRVAAAILGGGDGDGERIGDGNRWRESRDEEIMTRE